VASVGFDPKEWVINEERHGIDFKKQELWEFSIVPIGSNKDALQQARSAGIDMEPVREWAARILDEWVEEKGIWLPKEAVEEVHKQTTTKTIHVLPSSAPAFKLKEDITWPEVVETMVELLGGRENKVPEDQRQGVYDALAAKYEEAGHKDNLPDFKSVEKQLLELSDLVKLSPEGKLVSATVTATVKVDPESMKGLEEWFEEKKAELEKVVAETDKDSGDDIEIIDAGGEEEKGIDEEGSALIAKALESIIDDRLRAVTGILD
jgi:hypothetical protein